MSGMLQKEITHRIYFINLKNCVNIICIQGSNIDQSQVSRLRVASATCCSPGIVYFSSMDVVKLPLFLGVHDGIEITALHKIIFEHVEYIMKDVCVRKQALDWVFFGISLQ